MRLLTVFCFIFYFCLHAAVIDSAIKAPKVKRPEAQEKIIWRKDLKAGFAEAKLSSRPLFITFRCLPCKQCLDFDKSVLDGGPELGPLLKEFITVRLTDAEDLNNEIFRYKGYQDLDLSWWGYFLSPEGQIYSIFGGKDHVSDKTRISVAALRNTMDRVLNHHYNKDRKVWAVDGPEADVSKTTGKP